MRKKKWTLEFYFPNSSPMYCTSDEENPWTYDKKNKWIVKFDTEQEALSLYPKAGKWPFRSIKI